MAHHPVFAFLGNLGPMEIILILFLVLLLFGAKRLPELARSLGKSVTEFKKATSSAEQEFRQAMDAPPPPAPAPAPRAAPPPAAVEPKAHVE